MDASKGNVFAGKIIALIRSDNYPVDFTAAEALDALHTIVTALTTVIVANVNPLEIASQGRPIPPGPHYDSHAGSRVDLLHRFILDAPFDTIANSVEQTRGL